MGTDTNVSQGNDSCPGIITLSSSVLSRAFTKDTWLITRLGFPILISPQDSSYRSNSKEEFSPPTCHQVQRICYQVNMEAQCLHLNLFGVGGKA